MKLILLLYIILFVNLKLFTQQQLQDSTTTDTIRNAFYKISLKERPEEGSVKFYQDKRIELLITENSSLENTSILGYRVQVFSSNLHGSAKEEAFNLEYKLTGSFPGIKVYVSYSSPFWKVRIGDFINREEAQSLLEEVTSKFPTLKKNTYIVKDYISLSGK